MDNKPIRNNFIVSYRIFSKCSKQIHYTYDASGVKQENRLPSGEKLQYLGNFVYNAGSLEYILNEEGKLNVSSTGDNTYQFFVKDHLGNTRLSLSESGSVEEINHYYPFGMRMAGAKQDVTQKYRYNGKELQDETDWLDYGARMYDPVLGRFTTMDVFSEKYATYSPYTYCANNPISSIDINGDSTVVVISGSSKTWYTNSNTGNSYLVYALNVYTDMSLDQYNTHVANGTLPDPDHTQNVARDAHDITSRGNTVEHSTDRYGENNETPPGTYFLFEKGTNGDSEKGSYELYIGDSNGSRSIDGPDGIRVGIAIHQYDPNDSQGCITTCSGTSTTPITDLKNAIPDLSDDSQPVRLIIQQRKASNYWTYSNSSNGTKWTGTVQNIGRIPTEEEFIRTETRYGNKK